MTPAQLLKKLVDADDELEREPTQAQKDAFDTVVREVIEAARVGLMRVRRDPPDYHRR